MNKEVAEAFVVRCNGVSSETTEYGVEASVTIYDNGDRDVGCPVIGRSGEEKNCCQHPIAKTLPELVTCAHLCPQSR